MRTSFLRTVGAPGTDRPPSDQPIRPARCWIYSGLSDVLGRLRMPLPSYVLGSYTAAHITAQGSPRVLNDVQYLPLGTSPQRFMKPTDRWQRRRALVVAPTRWLMPEPPIPWRQGYSTSLHPQTDLSQLNIPTRNAPSHALTAVALAGSLP